VVIIVTAFNSGTTLRNVYNVLLRFHLQMYSLKTQFAGTPGRSNRSTLRQDTDLCLLKSFDVILYSRVNFLETTIPDPSGERRYL